MRAFNFSALLLKTQVAQWGCRCQSKRGGEGGGLPLSKQARRLSAHNNNIACDSLPLFHPRFTTFCRRMFLFLRFAS